jgi:HD-GYP domain-containing protein (c-di-GMP phosphodiesterase class II)/DNA-binding CsgD family transcriptional regulator
VIATLSLAIDLGMGVPLHSMLRSAVVSVRLGEVLGLDGEDLAQIYYVALLRWIGCTSDASPSAAAFGDELVAASWFMPLDRADRAAAFRALVRNVGAGARPWTRAQRVARAMTAMPGLMEGARAHCEVGQSLATRLGLRASITQALGHAFERWDGRGEPQGLRGNKVALAARVVSLVQDACVFYEMGGVEAAVHVVEDRSGGAYDPGLAERFCRHAGDMLDLPDNPSVSETLLDLEPEPRLCLSGDEFDTALRAMADFTDLKSPHLRNHSSGVAALAREAAARYGLPDAQQHDLYRAALVHDIGRVGVSAGIWDREGPLSEDEWERVRLHPYYTERVLNRLDACAPLSSLAASHHERSNGSGYHRALPAAMLTPATRVLAAADVYHAMTEPRPHRSPLSRDAAAVALRSEVREGRLEGEAVDAVLVAAGHPVSPRRKSWPAGLSEREVEVLRLIARGLSKREMARELVVSIATVDHHIRHIYNKIGMSTRAGATLFALQHDLVHDLDLATAI